MVVKEMLKTIDPEETIDGERFRQRSETAKVEQEARSEARKDEKERKSGV